MSQRYMRSMGLTNNKLMTSTENRIDKAINDFELLNNTGKQRAQEFIDVFGSLERSLTTLKGEREFLKRQLRRLETQTYISSSSKDRRVIYYEADTQTETEGEVNLSILIEALRSRNEKLEEENIKLKEKIKPKESSLVCQAVLPLTVGDEYVQTGEQNMKNKQSDCEEILIDNDILKQEIRKLGIQLTQERKDYEETRKKNKEIEKNSAEKSLFDLNKLMTEKDATVTDLENTLSKLDDQFKKRGQTIKEQKVNLEELRKQIQNKDSELILYKQKMDTDLKKLKTELSLYEVNFQNEKMKTKDLENNVLQLEKLISDLKLMKKKLETDLEINETTAKQEKVKLQNKLAEQSRDYAFLFEKCESLEKEKETLSQMKKHLSFHSVLRQPQSDQAVSGILSLLQTEMSNSHLEVIQESERNKDIPLLVVLYNLSNLVTDAKTAFGDIEAAPNVALVVLHSKAVKKPSKQIITELDFKQLGIIVDMSFLSSKGIISNELTGDAIQQLVEFIKRF